MLIRPAIILLPLALVACASTGGHQSTRMTLGDLDAMGAAMADSLAASEALRERTPQSEPWVISTDRVTNLSTDVMTESEKWFLIHKLQSTLPLRALKTQRNITFVIPKERMDELKANPNLDVSDDPNFGAGRNPTHQMSATFRGGVRAFATERTDEYLAQFEIMDLRTAVPVWTGKFNYKRAATGHIWD